MSRLLEIVTDMMVHRADPDIVADILSVPFSRQLLNSETVTWVEAAFLLCREYLLLEPTSVHGTRNHDRYRGIITRTILRYQKTGSEDKRPNSDRRDSRKQKKRKESSVVGGID